MQYQSKIMMEIDNKLNEKLRQQMDGRWEENEEIEFRLIAQSYAKCENAIAVLSNLRTNRSFIYFGKTSQTLEIGQANTSQEVPSIWEEEILNRTHPDDLRRRYLQEMAFFHFVATTHSEKAFHWYLENSMRMSNKKGKYHHTRHRIFYFQGKGQRGISYALCLYNLTTKTSKQALLKNTLTGEERLLDIDDKQLLTKREKTILTMVKEGLSSKMISEQLQISKNTIDRHRQNIISKMQASNTAEACHKAIQLGLIE